MKTAFIFTGQGFASPGMLHELVKLPDAHEQLLCAEDILGKRWESLDTKEALYSNENVQLCIFICECIFSRLISSYFSCDFVLGHSVGSFGAALYSGVLKFEDCLRLVQARGAKMEQLFSQGYGMIAVCGMDSGLMEKTLNSFHNSRSKECVWLATVNEEHQCVLSGALKDLEDIAVFIRRNYPAKISFLKVKVPSHCPLMDPVAGLLSELCNRIVWESIKIPYVSASTARRAWNIKQIQGDLMDGVRTTVKWYDSISLLAELGVDTFIECSTAHTLTDIGRRCYGDLRWIRGWQAITGKYHI